LSFLLRVKYLPPTEYTISIRHPRLHDVTDDEEDEENIPSSSDKQGVPGDAEAGDSLQGGKE
jgi:hypothetical protein